MGVLHYGDAQFAFDDRSLAHLQIIISTKLRRAENFFLSWDESSEQSRERVAIWVDNGVPIYFQYFSTGQASINRHWIEQIATQASSSAGIHLAEKVIPEEG
jgi:hypothetical protein